MIPFYIRQIGKILSGFANDIEFGFLTGNNSLEGGICLNHYIIVRQFTDNFGKDLCIQSNNASFFNRTFDPYRWLSV